MRNNIIAICISAAFLVLGVTSCDSFFDPIPGTQYDLEATFQDRLKTEQFLNNIYDYVPLEANEHGLSDNAGIWTAGSLESKINWTSNIGGTLSAEWNTGKVYSSHARIDDWFIEYYKGISKASTFIANVDKCMEAAESERMQWKAQARALRALYYFYLFRMYGPIVIIGEEPLPLDIPVSELLMARNTVDECVNWICSEFDKAVSEGLPAKYEGGNLGRIDAAACMAFKAKTLLYAASPLFNNNKMYADLKNTDGTVLFPQDGDAQEKWSKAKDAYEHFFRTYGSQYHLTYVYLDPESKTKIDHYESCRTAFTYSTPAANTELIFSRLTNKTLDLYCHTPYHKHVNESSIKGGLGFGTSQQMVDMYFTDKGLRIEDDPDYVEYEGIPGPEHYGWETDYNDPFNPSRNYFKKNTNKTLKQWANREPRFYVAITFNGSTWLKTDTSAGEVTTELTYNGNSGFAAANWDAPYSGYGFRKPYAIEGKSNTNNYVCLLRLSDMYLGYAECCAALEDYDTALEYVNKIRARAGVPLYGDAAGQISVPQTEVEVTKRVRRERLVELAYEWNRFFDVRRWKAADGKSVDADWLYPEWHTGGEGGAFIGMNYMADAPEFFEKVVLENRVFSDKMYFFPIPENDVLRNPKMVQNYGWSVSNAQ